MPTVSGETDANKTIARPRRRRLRAICGVCVRYGWVLVCKRCHYKSCHSCIATWIKFRISQGASQLTCFGCDQQLPDRTVEKFCPSAFHRYLYNQARRQNVGSRNAVWCPNVDCQTLLRDGASVCHKCETEICRRCRNPAHEGKCPKRGSAYCTTEIWKMLNTKECPKCKVRIEKNGGCRLVVCTACKAQFCWPCGVRTSQPCQCSRARKCRRGIVYLGEFAVFVPLGVLAALMVDMPIAVWTHISMGGRATRRAFRRMRAQRDRDRATVHTIEERNGVLANAVNGAEEHIAM